MSDRPDPEFLFATAVEQVGGNTRAVLDAQQKIAGAFRGLNEGGHLPEFLTSIGVSPDTAQHMVDGERVIFESS